MTSDQEKWGFYHQNWRCSQQFLGLSATVRGPCFNNLHDHPSHPCHPCHPSPLSGLHSWTASLHHLSSQRPNGMDGIWPDLPSACQWTLRMVRTAHKGALHSEKIFPGPAGKCGSKSKMFIGFPICGRMNIRNYQLFWCENQATSGGSLRAILESGPNGLPVSWAADFLRQHRRPCRCPTKLLGSIRSSAKPHRTPSEYNIIQLSSMIHPKTGTASWCNLDNLAFWNCRCPQIAGFQRGPDCEFVHDATPSFVDHLGVTVERYGKVKLPSHQSCVFTSMITFSETSCTRVVSSLPNLKSRGQRSAFIWSCLLRSCFLWLCLTNVSLKFQKRSTKAVNTLERKH